MFVDSVEITLSSGNGGAGCVAFRREKFVVNGGPNGGDGGRGGDIYFVCSNNTHTLSKFQHKMHIKADNGRPGEGSNMTGKSGAKKIVIVPPGTQVVDDESGEVLFDMLEDGQEELFLVGGKGGLGNTHFKSSTNQRPTYAQPGIKGETKTVRLELRLIADVGLVGFPNVGKSTLISTLSNAKPEIANYEFTTLTPKLGQVQVGDFESFVMADIPGIIDGASEGRGLGLEFLKHIERTKILLFMVDIDSYKSTTEQIDTLKDEVQKFSQKLHEQRYAIVLTRADVLGEDELDSKIKEFLEYLGLSLSQDSSIKYAHYKQSSSEKELGFDIAKPYFVMALSSATHLNTKPLKNSLFELVSSSKADIL